MIDPKYLRDEKDLNEIKVKLAERNYTLDTGLLLSLEEKRKSFQSRTQELQSQRNSFSKQIGQAKRNGEDASAIMAEVAKVGEELDEVKKQQDEVLAEISKIAYTIPNLPDDSVPVGKDDSFNVEQRHWGEPRKFDFEVKDHVALGEAIGGLDFDSARKVTGSRFVFMKGDIARLHRALGQFMLDLHTQQQGYTEICVPYLVNSDSLYGTGQLPKFELDLFHTLLTATGDEEGVQRRYSRRGSSYQPGPRRAPPGEGSPDQDHGSHPLLQIRGRQRRTRYPRPYPHAPVRQGRDGPDCPSREVLGGA